MAQGLEKSQKRRPRADDGASKAAVAVQAGATLSCPFCGFLAAEYGLLLHMEEAHAEGGPPFAGGSAENQDGSGGGGPEARIIHGGGHGAKVVHLKRANAPMQRPASAAPDAATASASGLTGSPGSLSDSGSLADDDGEDDGVEGEGNEEELRFAECPVHECHESVLASEMAYHIDLHAALDYQDRVTDGHVTDNDADASGDRHRSSSASEDGEGAGSDSKPDGKSDTPTTRRASKNQASRSSSFPPETRRGSILVQSPSMRRSDKGRKRRVTYELQPEHDGGQRDGGKEGGGRDDSHEHHRERRERQRSRDQSRGRGHDRTHVMSQLSKLGLSTPAPNSGPQQPAQLKKPSTTVRSWWAFWSGYTPRKLSTSEGKAKAVLGQGARPSSVSKSGSPKAGASHLGVPKRLGKAELGKYANEERMPDALAVYLKKEWGFHHKGVIPVLKQLLEQSPATEYAYLCDPCVQHVSRLPKEGGFCGYRNLQTLISYIVGAKFPGYDRFGEDLPSVFDLQNFIEDAWDKGINPRGRIETGGIRWTRKYIGTPEAITLFQSLSIPCSVRAFRHKQPEKTRQLLLRDIEQYFQGGNYQPGRKVRATTLPPIYWQHPGHSLTIVGIEKTTAGETNLLVFDPIVRDGSAMARLIGHRRAEQIFPDQLLKPYRRGPKYLSRYRAFEILKLQPRAEDVVQVGP